MKYILILLLLCPLAFADVKQIQTSCVIYEIDTGATK